MLVGLKSSPMRVDKMDGGLYFLSSTISKFTYMVLNFILSYTHILRQTLVYFILKGRHLKPFNFRIQSSLMN